MFLCYARMSSFHFFPFSTQLKHSVLTLHMDERNREFWREVYKYLEQTEQGIQAGNDIFQVSTWPEKYGCDGIDLDLEEGAGARYVYFSGIFS